LEQPFNLHNNHDILGLEIHKKNRCVDIYAPNSKHILFLYFNDHEKVFGTSVCICDCSYFDKEKVIFNDGVAKDHFYIIPLKVLEDGKIVIEGTYYFVKKYEHLSNSKKMVW